MALLSPKSNQRAITALKGLPFNYSFYKDVQNVGMEAKTVFMNSDLYCLTGEKWFKKESSVEAAFRWLIKIGVLRREVDGQGLTSKIRLTPFGRTLISNKQELISKKAGFLENLGLWINQSLN